MSFLSNPPRFSHFFFVVVVVGAGVGVKLVLVLVLVLVTVEVLLLMATAIGRSTAVAAYFCHDVVIFTLCAYLTEYFI